MDNNLVRLKVNKIHLKIKYLEEEWDFIKISKERCKQALVNCNWLHKHLKNYKIYKKLFKLLKSNNDNKFSHNLCDFRLLNNISWSFVNNYLEYYIFYLI